MHWIRTHILEQLLYHETRRNRDLRPPGVESNLFQYHLSQLVKDGWVAKTPERYMLAPRGLAWADKYSGQLKDIRPQTKLVTIIGLRNEKGEYALIRKARQPFVGKWYMPSGKMRHGEPIVVAAHREAHEKLGLTDVPMEFTGTIRVCVRSTECIVTDYLGFMFEVISRKCETPYQIRWFLPKASNDQEFAPGTLETIEALKCRIPHTETLLEDEL